MIQGRQRVHSAQAGRGAGPGSASGPEQFRPEESVLKAVFVRDVIAEEPVDTESGHLNPHRRSP